MAPEIRWAVLRAAIENNLVPGRCLGLLTYLYVTTPETIKCRELAEVLDLSDKTIRTQLRELEVAGFIAVTRQQHGKALHLRVPTSMPNGVHTVKVGHPDTSFQNASDLHQIGKIDRPEPQIGKIDRSGTVEIGKIDRSGIEIGKIDCPEIEQIGKIDRPEIEIGKIARPETGEFLRGMLEALENGSKPEV